MQQRFIVGIFLIAGAVGTYIIWPHSRPSINTVENVASVTSPQTQVQAQTKKIVESYGTQEPSAQVLQEGPVLPQSHTSSTSTNQKKIMTATLHTNKGDITLEFFGEAPNTVNNFLKLADSGFYDGVKFHRVIAGFMIQGGDQLSKDDTKSAQWGTGGPGYKFADEIYPDNKNIAGTIAMANAGPNTNGSQFFINVKDNNFLDTKHTVFGRVVAGLEVIKAIEATPVNGSDRPLEPVVIKNITLK